MLRRGGNAIDAAVATAFAVGVAEPQMSGLGGGGGMLIWLDDDERAEYMDFYAAKPAARYRGLPAPGDSMPLRVVAVPGMTAGLLDAHERYGRLTRADVMEPAIRLAEEGVHINQVLAQMIAADSAKLNRWPSSSDMLWPGGQPRQPGELLRQPELAETLRLIADRGRDGYYHGEVARDVVEHLNAGGNPVTLEDLAEYEPQWKRPLCGDYRGQAVLSAPPPQTGHQIIHTLKLVEPHDVAAMGLPTQSAEAFDVLTSAMRAGIAANRHNDDPNWVQVPAAGLTSAGYAADRANVIGTGRAVEAMDGGEPARWDAEPPSDVCEPFEPYGPAAYEDVSDHLRTASAAPLDDEDADDGETTHISVVDGDGNAVALSQTISSIFGSGASVRGFFLNNSGYNFASSPDEATGRHAWRIRKSTIAPTIVLDDDKEVRLVAGAPGAGRIPTAVVQTMIYTLDYGLDPLRAIRMPRIFPTASGTRVQLEPGFNAETLAGARAMGYEPAALSSGYARLYMIVRDGERWIGAADPRHDGEARGF